MNFILPLSFYVECLWLQAANNNAGFLLDSMFDFAEHLNELKLKDEELGLFSALVVIASDRLGLRYADQVARLQATITQGLQTLIQSNHPDDPSIFSKLLMKIPDLRTLNTLHSEKLLGMVVSHPLPSPIAASCLCCNPLSLIAGLTISSTEPSPTPVSDHSEEKPVSLPHSR